jgi:hypothetical protein
MKKGKLLGDSIKALLQYLQKYISPFPALFIPGKRFYLRNRFGKTKCAGI